jgi:hypothetical protein
MDAKTILVKAKDRSILNHFTLPIAPTRVDRLIHRAFCGIPRDHTVHEPECVPTLHFVFEERRYVDQTGGISDGMVFWLVLDFIRARDKITGPVPPIVAHAQGRSAGMKRSPKGHRVISEFWI